MQDSRPMEETWVPIHGRGRHRVQEWELVLASMGIQTAVERDGRDWILKVPPKESQRAFQVLRVYTVENRHWGGVIEEPVPSLTGLWHVWSLFPVLAWGWIQWFHGGKADVWREKGCLLGETFQLGQPWRLVTSQWLHGGWEHLTLNTLSALVLLGLCGRILGWGVAFLGALLAGVGGNLFGIWLQPMPYASLGASGMILGGLGLLVGAALRLRRWGRLGPARGLATFAGGCMLFALLGASESSDWVVHLGGFLTGIPLGWFGFGLWGQSPRWQWVAGGSAMGLTAWCWYLAIGSGSPF